jgi:tight adherence protein C
MGIMIVYIMFFYIGIVMLVWSIFVSPRVIRLRLPHEAKTYHRKKPFPILSVLFPFTKPILEKTRWDVPIKHKIDAAHINMTPAEFVNLKLILTFGLAAVFLVVRSGTVLFIGLAALIGFMLPDLYLRNKRAKRCHEIVMFLPETVDLLTMCVEAGFDFTSALKWIIEKTTPNPMIEELAFVLEEIKWGKPRMQAIKDMGKRLGMPEVNSFVQTLKQSETLGTPVAEALSNLAEDTRHQRFLRGERIAMQAPVKMLIPLIFCILPVIGIVVAAPVLIQFTKGGAFPTVGSSGSEGGPLTKPTTSRR